MDNEKNIDFNDEIREEEEFADTTSRARNRTVMLTPEITGEVRARLAQDLGHQGAEEQQGAESVGHENPSQAAPASQSSFGESGRGSSYIPAGEVPVEEPPQVAPPAKQMPQAEPVSIPAGEGVFWAKDGLLVGFLLAFDQDPNGKVFELRAGRLIVSSESPGSGNYLIINDDTVSPMHAIMRITEGGEIQVLDQLSEFGTKIRRFATGEVEELSGDKSSLKHGDVISFGGRSFNVCLIARADEA